MDPILVTGGTGTLGRQVVQRLRAAGHDPRVLSRRPVPDGGPPGRVTGDLESGAGIDHAVRGTAAVVHAATRPGHDVEATRTLIAAARRAGTLPHLVYISIVGVDRVPLRYYRDKLAVERLVEDSGMPWTVLRATQFHDLLARIFGVLAHSPVLPVPAGTSVQPVDVGEVADRLVALTVGPPAGRVPDMGGPEVRPAAELARAWLDATGRRRGVLPVRLPGAAAHGYRAGGHLAPRHRDGRVRFEEYLAAGERS